MQNYPRRSVLAASATLATSGALVSVGSRSARADRCQETVVDQNGWSSYRGNAGNSRSIPVDGGFDEPDTIAWQYDERGAIAVVDGTVYLRTGSEIHALDATDGSVQWTSGDLGPVGGRPAVVDGIVYVGGRRLTALDASSGTVRWTRELNNDWLAPLVAFKTVYALMDGSLYAFDAADGSLRWQRDAVAVGCSDGSEGSKGETCAFSTGRACVAATDGTLWVALEAESPGAMAALDPQTGNVQWASFLEPVHHVGGLAATREKVFIEDTEQETGYAFDIASKELAGSIGDALWISGTGSIAVSLWRRSLTATHVDRGVIWSKQHSYAFGYPTIVGDTVVVTHSKEDPLPDEEACDELVAFDLGDGSEKWRFTFDEQQWSGAYHIGCAVTEDTIYVNREEGITAVRRSTSETGGDGDRKCESDGNATSENESDGGPREYETAARNHTDENETQRGDPGSDRNANGTGENVTSESGGTNGESTERGTGGNETNESDGTGGNGDAVPGFTAVTGITGGLLSLEWLRRRDESSAE